MAAPILKNPAAAVARTRMRQVFYKAEQDIIDEINRKRLAGYVDYAEVAALERVQQILTDMQDKVGDYMPKYIEKIFYNATEKDAHGYANARSLTSTQLNIEQQLVNNLMGTLIEAEAVAFESAKRAFLVGQTEENIFREATLHHLLEGEAMGRSWRITSKNMAIDLQKSGITAFTDKAGRKWSLTDYCDMCTRTTARQAEVAAALTADDWDLWQIAAIGSTCKLCAAYEGRVYSKSGTNPDYPPLWAAFGKIDINGGNDLANTYLNIHPACLHSLLKYTTMGKTDEQIQRDKEFSSFEKRPADVDYRTRKQRDAYREKERNRAKLISDRNQWQRYREAFGDEIPDFESFRRNKVDGTAKYQKWESEYKSFRAKGAEVEKILEEVRPAQVLSTQPLAIREDGSKAYKAVVEIADANKVMYNPPTRLTYQPTEDEIIRKISGGDMTEGSCASLAYAYCGNKGGLDITDFRGGSSRWMFSQGFTGKDILELPGVKGQRIKVPKELKGAAEVLNTILPDKEYYFAAGKHAAIVRKVEGHFEYLELQSADKSGWQRFVGGEYKTASGTLMERFGCRKTVSGNITLIEADSLENSDEFKELLGYLNTNGLKEMKGALGGIK